MTDSLMAWKAKAIDFFSKLSFRLPKLPEFTMTPLLYLTGALAISLPALYGGMIVREKIVVRAAVEVAEAKGVTTCNIRVSEIERVHNAKVAKGVDEAKRAENLVPDAPETDEALAALCKKSASCRSRSAL